MADTLIDLTNLEAVLQDFARYFETDYKDRLIAHDRYASGELLESVHTEVVVGDTAYEVTVSLADYWKYVEEDTPPHWPPPTPILRWVEVKPTLPRPLKLDGKEISPKSLAFLIRRAIAGKSPNQAQLKNPRGGTTGTHDLRDAKQETIERFRQRIAEALGHDFQAYILKVMQSDLPGGSR